MASDSWECIEEDARDMDEGGDCYGDTAFSDLVCRCKRLAKRLAVEAEPDSAERIAEDAVKLAPSYYLKKRGIECAHGEDPVQLKLDDVVRRCKRLAGEE